MERKLRITTDNDDVVIQRWNYYTYTKGGDWITHTRLTPSEAEETSRSLSRAATRVRCIKAAFPDSVEVEIPKPKPKTAPEPKLTFWQRFKRWLIG